MDRMETTLHREKREKSNQESHITSTSAFLTVLPPEVRNIIYDLLLGDHRIHIKSDLVLQNSQSKDAEDRWVNHEAELDEEGKEQDESEEEQEDEKSEEYKQDEGDKENGEDKENEEDEENDERENERIENEVELDEEDEAYEEEEEAEEDEDAEGHEKTEEEDEDEEGTEMRENVPAELSEIWNDDRGPLYHRLCNEEELLHPKDACRYRIRRLEAKSSSTSRVQPGIIVEDFGLSDPNLDYERRVSLEAAAIAAAMAEEEGEEGEEEEEEEGRDEEEKAEKKRDEPAAQISLAFLRVNRQIYDEASNRLYSSKTFGFDDPVTFAQFFAFRFNHSLKSPTPIKGTVLLSSRRNSIRSIYIRAKIALQLRQRILWMSALDAAHFVLPELRKIRVLFDLCHEGNERYVDSSRWQYTRHHNGIRLLESAEVRVATHFSVFANVKDIRSLEFREVGYRVQLVEAIAGHHLDVLFGGSLLDKVSVEARDAIFAQQCFVYNHVTS